LGQRDSKSGSKRRLADGQDGPQAGPTSYFIV